jgi:hypothetical protein
VISERRQIHPRQEALAGAKKNRGVGQVQLIDKSISEVFPDCGNPAAQADIFSLRSLSSACKCSMDAVRNEVENIYNVQTRLSLRIEGPSEDQLTSTNTSETSSEGGPLRHASTLSRIPSIISPKGRSAASRTNSRRPGTPSISSRELKTSVIPSE